MLVLQPCALSSSFSYAGRHAGRQVQAGRAEHIIAEGKKQAYNKTVIRRRGNQSTSHIKPTICNNWSNFTDAAQVYPTWLPITIQSCPIQGNLMVTGTIIYVPVLMAGSMRTQVRSISQKANPRLRADHHILTIFAITARLLSILLSCRPCCLYHPCS